MDYNPLTSRLREFEQKVDGRARRRAILTKQLDWYRTFDLKSATEKLEQQESQLSSRHADLAASTIVRGRLETALEELTARTEELEVPARMGWNPGYWFSHERSRAKVRLTEHLKRVEALRIKLESHMGKERRIEAAVGHWTGRSKATLDKINRFKEFNESVTKEEIRKIDSELPFLEFELGRLADRKAYVDEKLKAPLSELRRYVQEIEMHHDKITRLSDQRSSLKADLGTAQRLDSKISQAANSYERAMLHQECERLFGKGSPAAVARDLKFEIGRHQAKVDYEEREVARLRRDMAKTEERLKRIAEVAGREINALIIDGKNCCFEGNQFIGLSALFPLVKELCQRYDVTVVFDASIRRDLGFNDDDLRNALGPAKVHVVASRGKADETILDTARDPTVWVISNDRFGDYRDKAPVKANRIIRHEILRGRVLVHDLDVDVPLARRRD